MLSSVNELLDKIYTRIKKPANRHDNISLGEKLSLKQFYIILCESEMVIFRRTLSLILVYWTVRTSLVLGVCY